MKDATTPLLTALARNDLADLNLAIPAAENHGASVDAEQFFQQLLAPAFAFFRANGEIVDRTRYLQSLSNGGDREPDPESIDILKLGERRAMVTCLVAMTVADQKRVFHNARLFVRDADERWRLLAWANEET